jgi:hypothetical protein
MTKFKLVNPVIIGKMDTKVEAENALQAASKIWSDLSSHLVGNVPKTYITLKDKTHKLHHFKIEEKIGRAKTAEYSISEVELDLSKDKEHKFSKEVKKYEKKGKELTGGSVENKPKRDRSKDSSSSSSFDSDDDDYYNFRRYRARLNAPINLLYYTPFIYGVDTVFFPTFSSVVAPYVTLYVPY